MVGLAILFILAILINMIRRRSLELKYALVWMLVLTALFVFDCAPALLNVVSGFLGIYAPVNMIYFPGILFSLLIIFSLTVALSRLSNSVRTLDQMVALNEKRLQDLEQELKRRKQNMKKKLIITGCNGQLGRAINKQLAGNEDYELVNTDVAELDITDIDKVMEMAREVKPYAILNCAAFTNVNGCETAGDIVWKINALGPRNLSIAATETGAKMMHISTDYVFNGNGTRPYTEFDTPDPKSAYGVTKLAGEKFVQQFAKSSSSSVLHGSTAMATIL